MKLYIFIRIGILAILYICQEKVNFFKEMLWDTKILFICEEYLKEIGTGPLSTLMVMRANVRIAIAQV